MLSSNSHRLSAEASAVPASGIAAIMKHGFGRSDIIPLWVGEGDLTTPPYISQEATASLGKGETFYMPQPGIPELRQALFVGRNARWSDRIADAIAQGNRPFVAVGAAHMAGPDGLPAMLAARGYTVRRVQ